MMSEQRGTHQRLRIADVPRRLSSQSRQFLKTAHKFKFGSPRDQAREEKEEPEREPRLTLNPKEGESEREPCCPCLSLTLTTPHTHAHQIGRNKPRQPKQSGDVAHVPNVARDRPRREMAGPILSINRSRTRVFGCDDGDRGKNVARVTMNGVAAMGPISRV